MKYSYRDKLFRGSSVENIIAELELLAKESKEKAERYRKDSYLQDYVSSEMHEGIYKGYMGAISLIKKEFDYPED